MISESVKAKRETDIAWKQAELNDLTDAVRNCRERLDILEQAYRQCERELDVLKARKEYNP